MNTAGLIATFSQHARPEKAAEMKRYMKDIAPYLGISRPERNTLQKEWLGTMKKSSWKDQEAAARELWNQPEREFHYAAMDMLVYCKSWKEEKSIDLFEELLTQTSWWDTVDTIAAKLVGPYLRQFPAKRDPLIDRWMQSGNMWLQRTCLIFQLGYKKDTDFDLLQACIIPLCHSREFFIQKAIGWALRQHARTNPDSVLRFVNSYELKPLSRREALKHFST